MAYVNPDYPTKKAFREAVEKGVQHEPYNPSLPAVVPVERNGRIIIEGPHYPKAHKWYASCFVENGIITKVR